MVVDSLVCDGGLQFSAIIIYLNFDLNKPSFLNQTIWFIDTENEE